MNTRRRARGVRDRANLSMTISIELQNVLKTWLIKYYIWSTCLWSPLLFVHGDACAETNRSCMEHRLGVPCFLYAALCVQKVIEVVWSIDREPLTDSYAALRM
jgi:hypothetical protein